MLNIWVGYNYSYKISFLNIYARLTMSLIDTYVHIQVNYMDENRYMMRTENAMLLMSAQK